MSKTLVTFDDGSEFTVTNAIAWATAGFVLSIATSIATVKVSDWRTRRWLKKNGHYKPRGDEASKDQAPN
jgi:hypothetical protein